MCYMYIGVVYRKTGDTGNPRKQGTLKKWRKRELEMRKLCDLGEGGKKKGVNHRASEKSASK